MMKIGVIIAMEKEFVRVAALLSDRSEVRHDGGTFVTGRLGDNEIVMMQCGIGKVNAAVGTARLLGWCRPDLVVSTGVAGGADVGMNVMDVVASTECVYHDVYCGSEVAYGQFVGMPARFPSPPEIVERALRLNDDAAVTTPIRAGLIVTGDWFVDQKEKMADILRLFPEAKAVDMESCAIAHTCHLYGVPFISLRIISDIPLKDTRASQYFDFWKKVEDSSFEVTRKFLEK